MDSSSSSSLNDILKLLKGERDEQKLAGLLLASIVCKGDDSSSILKVYTAVGSKFLDRLLMTGMGKGEGGSVKSGEDREAYLKLSVTVLAGFCRVPEIAASKEKVSKARTVVEIISKSLDQSIFEECYMNSYFAAASEHGKASFYEPGVMNMLTPQIYNSQDGSRSLELAMRLLQLILNELPVLMSDVEHVPGLSHMVVALARQFAILQNALKFDALHMLTILLSSSNSLLQNALNSMPSKSWAAHVRLGITAILQNRVVSRENFRLFF